MSPTKATKPKRARARKAIEKHRVELLALYAKAKKEHGGVYAVQNRSNEYRRQAHAHNKKKAPGPPPDEGLKPAVSLHRAIYRKETNIRALDLHPKKKASVGVVKLKHHELGCGICGEEYYFDMNATEDGARKRLPVISWCDHTSCHGCILKWQVARAETNNGRAAKRVQCITCKKNAAICPSEPKYNRRLIDLLARCVPVEEKQFDTRGMVTLNDSELGCGICGEDYSFDMDATEDDARERLPVISSCDHTSCHGCILKWQVARAEMNNGRVAERVSCMLCKKNSAICPGEPKYDRRLIDLLGRCSR